MSTLQERRAASDKRVADDIANYGCHVISVFDPDDEKPTFSYSVGIQVSTGSPEAIVIGLSADLGHSIMNEYRDQLRAGTFFRRGTLYAGFLEGFSVYVEPAEPALQLPYTLGCARYYKDRPYSTVQIVYPTTNGVWPWEESASESFKVLQPMLGRARPDQP